MNQSKIQLTLLDITYYLYATTKITIVELTTIIKNSLNENIIECVDYGNLFPKKFVSFIIKVIVHNWCSQLNCIMNGKISLVNNEIDQIKVNSHRQSF